MKYALIKNSAVENVIEADNNFVALIADEWDHIEPLDTPHEQGLGVGIGWRYDAATRTFTGPQPTADPVAASRRISGLAFRRRFTREERAAIEWAAVDKPELPDADRRMAATLRSNLKDQEQAKFIDLDDSELIEGVATLEAFELLAVGRAAQILEAPVQDADRA